MTGFIIAIIFSLLVLTLGADRFVKGACVTAGHFGMPPLLIGMVIIGFGTSAPEMVVSALAALQGNPGLALGNAYGSNIANLALILGLTGLLRPIAVQSQVLRKELPILTAVTVLAALQLWDGHLSRTDAWILLTLFFAWMIWVIQQGLHQKNDSLIPQLEPGVKSHGAMKLKTGIFWLVLGFALMILSSRILVWGAIEIAHIFGVSDLVIGLTIVAIGTSLPELASSLMAMVRGEHELALGNVLGSNLFNTLAVVGIAGAIHPGPVLPEVFYRDCMVMGALTLSLFAIGYGFRGPGRINRFEGAGLMTAYVGYTGWLILVPQG